MIQVKLIYDRLVKGKMKEKGPPGNSLAVRSGDNCLDKKIIELYIYLPLVIHQIMKDTATFSKMIAQLTFHIPNLLREASYILNSTVSFASPRILEIEVTNYCPGDCIMCPRKYIFSRQLHHMPLDLFKQIVSQIPVHAQRKSSGAPPELHLFHYGDLCLYPHAYEAVMFAKHQGFYVVSSSLASLLTREKALEAVETRLDELWLMLDGMDEETSTKIRGKAASFTKAIENIRFLLHLKKSKGISYPKTLVFMIRQPANAHQWEEFREFFKALEPALHGHVAYFSNFGGNVPEINEILSQLQKMNGQPEEDQRVKHVNSYRCYYPWHSMCILSDGRVVPCCRDINGQYVLGDLNQKSLQEIWNDEPLQNLRREWIHGPIQNSLCVPCTEANNETGLPNKSFPFFYMLDRLLPGRFANPKARAVKK